MSLRATAIAAVALAAFGSVPAEAQRRPRADAGGSHLFFLHGRGVEEARGSSRRYGTFQFDQIVASLQAPGRTVHAPQREAGSIDGHASQIASQIQGLIASGVPARQIAVVGFSRGGHVALVTAARLRNPEISYVVLAGCTRGFENRAQTTSYATSGRILSLVDAADELAGPCGSVIAGQHRGGAFQESVLNTGRGHGLFYAADAAWLSPTRAWLP